MAHHWLLFLVGATLLQGAVLFSPIPLPDEEWETFNSLLRDPAYRLPSTTKPVHYELSLTPYFDIVSGPNLPPAFSFEGSVAIQITANEDNVTEIVMHCNDLEVSSVSVSYLDADNNPQEIATANQTLECQTPYSFLRISTILPLETGLNYTVNLKFTGNLQTNMRGFYRSWYFDSTGEKRWMATTQFQPGNARFAFPCYDEPGFKAFFDITINREPSFSPTLSNMPIRVSSNTSVSGRVSETFYTTPKTSTYLLAFIVSHYIEVAASDDVERPFQIFARDNVGSTGDWSLEVGVKLLKEMEDYTAIPYYTVAPYMNMKQAAIPDFSAGAMENWGLLTYREALILYDPVNSNHFYKQRVANIVSHEIAHMWFGNLVTCAWWDNLWLNEGFARFYQYYLTNKVAPDLGYETRFIVEQFSDAMAADSVDSAHALTDPNVNDPTTVSNHFSVISYARGACILRMTQHLLGEETYVKGLREYLYNRQFDVAVPEDLFEALDNAAATDSALSRYDGITINRYFRTWSEKAGHPLLTVNIDQASGNMIITQSRWERDTGVSLHNDLWDIPITWTRAGAADFLDLKPSQFITQESTTIDRGTNESEWVIFNKQASGFYRINYDLTNWGLITQALRSNAGVIHEYNRAQIVDDLFAFGRAGVLSYDQVFNIISFLEFDDQYASWIAAVSGFNLLIRRLAHDADNLNKLQGLIHQLSGAITDRLGFVERETEPYMDGLLRMNVMQFLCNAEHEECVNTGIQYFRNWVDGQFVPANMRPWVYCAGLRNGTAAAFNFFWNRYLLENLASEQVVMLQAAGCTTDHASLVRLLDIITDEEELIRPQDINTALNSAVTRNEVNTLRVLEWLKDNVERTTAKLGSIATPLSYITPRLLTTNDINELESWLQDNEALIGPAAFQTGNNGVVSARNNLKWSEERTEELEQYFDTGYQEPGATTTPALPDSITESTTEITTESTTEQPVTTTEQPITTTEQPVTTPEQPVTTTEQNVTTTEQPVTTPEQPVTTPEQPVTTTEQPVTTTEQPITTTEQPVTTTEQPVTTTEQPTEPPTTEEPTTPDDGDGAATIAVSLVALSVSLAVTFLN